MVSQVTETQWKSVSCPVTIHPSRYSGGWWWRQVSSTLTLFIHPSMREEQRRAQCKRLKAAVAAALLFLLSLSLSLSLSPIFLCSLLCLPRTLEAIWDSGSWMESPATTLANFIFVFLGFFLAEGFAASWHEFEDLFEVCFTKFSQLCAGGCSRSHWSLLLKASIFFEFQ